MTMEETMEDRMSRDGELKNGADDLLEELAELEHRQWAHWARYMLTKLGFSLVDGAVNVTEGRLPYVIGDVARWFRQMETPYRDLSEEEKDTDREWAHLALDVFAKHRNGADAPTVRKWHATGLLDKVPEGSKETVAAMLERQERMANGVQMENKAWHVKPLYPEPLPEDVAPVYSKEGIRYMNKQKVISALRGALAFLEGGGDLDDGNLEYLSIGTDVCSFVASKEAVDFTDTYLEPDGEWHPETEQVGWSVIVPVEKAVVVDVRPDPKGRWDKIVEYDLAPVCLCGMENGPETTSPHKSWCPKAEPWE